VSYQELDQWDSPNYTPAAQCKQVFGEARDVTSFTIHHWGDPSWGQTFEGVVSFLCDGNRASPTSAHFVVEAGRAACIVSPDDVAWHAGNAHGNATSIGIECNPLERDEDYQTIGELIAHLRTIYGDLPLEPHNHWTSTDCPGTYDLARIDAIARGTIQPASGGTPTPIQEDDMSYSQWPQADKDALVKDIAAKVAPAVWSGPGSWVGNRRLGHNEYAETILGSLEDRIQNEILPQALAGIKATVDPAALAAAIPADLAADVAAELGKRLQSAPPAAPAK
jgi:hypothetical protein